MPRVLLANDDAKLTACFDSFQVGGAIDSQELAAMRCDELIPAGDVAKRTRIDVASRKADRWMKNRDAGGSQLLEIPLSKTGRLFLPRR
jgi:hypothetical protein